ncbi:hypothetical protein JJV70_20305 [Streptomyces sp. JJ66]|uniref:hypothetical protein n=1 Tax=Streptomyces sp. JJ66 TaxID=2803843 RepID=UPI001C55B515|nr:hypothetical protein [Streptomyces sp. JJ66]MBW1604401.1 hypothetical protein [Streptomyces sp. JJ66]
MKTTMTTRRSTSTGTTDVTAATAAETPQLRAAGVTVRCGEDGIVWEDRTTVTRIPYEAVLSVSATSPNVRYVRLRLGLLDTGTGHPEWYELVCLRRAGEPFAAAVHRRVTGAGHGRRVGPCRRPVTVERRAGRFSLLARYGFTR